MGSDIGAKIKELLSRKGMKQKELARAIGTSDGHMSRVINGEVEPSYGKVEDIARALGVPMSAFEDEDIALPMLAESFISALPDDIVHALSDTRNRDWILLGLSMRDKTLTKDEIQIVLDSYAQAKNTLKEKGIQGK